jgi:hypothetical protein
MTMAEAVAHARQALGVEATEEDIADLAATFFMEDASPAELDRLFRAGARLEVFEVLLEHAADLTEEQIVALELTVDEAAQMAQARR